MKYLLCLFLLLPTLILAESQAIFFDATLSYDCIIRKQHKDVKAIFQGDSSASFYYKAKPYDARFTIGAGFSLDGSGEYKRLDYHGNIEAEFAYFLEPIWEPFFIQLNEFASLSNLYWRVYTGAGTKITAYDNHNLLIKFLLAPVLHYERFLRDRDYDIPEHDRTTMSHMFGALISYSFLTKLTIKAEWTIIPLYDFSECRVISKLILAIELFREDYDRKSGADFEAVFKNDHFTHPPTYKKSTDYICTVGLRFFM
jgi:hypothetical protein